MVRLHRRSLHRRAARVAEQRLIGVINLMDARRLWRIRVNHLLSGARSNGREASASSFLLIGRSTLLSLADTLEEAACAQPRSCGRPAQCLGGRAQLWKHAHTRLGGSHEAGAATAYRQL